MTDDSLRLSRREILASAGIIGTASVGAGLGTSAFLTDTERFASNSIRAGAANLLVDVGIVSVSAGLADSGTVQLGVADDGETDPTTIRADGAAQLGLTVTDMKPGDAFVLRTTVTVEGNPMFVTARAENADDSENRPNPEPEQATQRSGTDPDTADGSGAGNGSDGIGDGDGDDAGDLDNRVLVTFGYDPDRTDLHDNTLESTASPRITPEAGFDGRSETGSTATAFLTTLERGLQYRGRNGPRGSPPGGHGGRDAAPTRIGGDRSQVRVDREQVTHFIKFELPAGVGNVIQGDSFTADLVFVAQQVRHNTSGSSATATRVEDWTDLDALRNDLSGDYVLATDLDDTSAGYDAVASGSANGGGGFSPIGGSVTPFTGTFDGNGHRIADLVIDRESQAEVGLFGAIGSDGSITNTRLTAVDITGSSRTAGLAARNHGTVEQVSVGGSLDGTGQVGMLTGLNTGRIESASAGGSVGAGSIAGGIVGRNEGTVRAGSASVDVTATDALAGGVVGSNAGAVHDTTANGAVMAPSTAGGLVGSNSGRVVSADATGATDGTTTLGGLVGTNTQTGTIRASTATGETTGRSVVGGLAGTNAGAIGMSSTAGPTHGTGSNIGGFVGFNTGRITESTATGAVDGTADFVGGLVGTNDGGTVRASSARGDVTTDEALTRVYGGLVGANVGGGEVRTSAAFGAVESVFATSGGPGTPVGTEAVGALVGANTGGKVAQSYARGSAVGTAEVGGLVGVNSPNDAGNGGIIRNGYTTAPASGATTVGALVGTNDTGGVPENLYWEGDGSRDAIGSNSGTATNLVALTTDELKGATAETTMTALDFTTVWQSITGKYPTLRTLTD